MYDNQNIYIISCMWTSLALFHTLHTVELYFLLPLIDYSNNAVDEIRLSTETSNCVMNCLYFCIPQSKQIIIYCTYECFISK